MSVFICEKLLYLRFQMQVQRTRFRILHKSSLTRKMDHMKFDKWIYLFYIYLTIDHIFNRYFFFYNIALRVPLNLVRDFIGSVGRGHFIFPFRVLPFSWVFLAILSSLLCLFFFFWVFFVHRLKLFHEIFLFFVPFCYYYIFFFWIV